MTEYMAQQGLSLAPSSRQDIISALLNDYGSSFDDGNNSPYKMSSVPAFKELPPSPPPERERARNYSNYKASPAVQKMNTPFQLRDVPASPDSSNGSSSAEGSPSRIVSKRLKRRSVPRSLTLTVSNGSTAELPSAPTIASQPEAQNPFNTPADKKELPPPPPEKSTRRQQSAMGNQSSTARSPRKDSLHSQDGKEDMEPVRRKPLPLPKFTSLADLGNGPRGGKGGPLPQPRARKQSLEDTENDRGRTMVRNDGAETVPRENAPPKLRDQPTPMAAPRIVNPLPPTPKDEPIAAPPTSSKKPFGGMGLPSNPKHKKGKSDTGFDVLKSATSPQQQQLPTLPQTITPGPTPSPLRTEKMRNEGIVDQTGLSPEVQNSQRRPFSFEPVPTSSPQLKEPAEEPYPTASINASPAQQPSPSVPPTTTPQPSFPPRSASRLPPPPAFASLPSQQRSSATETMSMSEEESSPPSTPFVPLTQAPTHVPNPPITERHHACYSRHATFVWSKNSFQPMACMICANDDAERRWACVWCYLRICVDCSEELQRTPGRNLARVLESREKEVSKREAEARYAGEEYEEEEGMHPGFETGGDAKGNVNGKRHDSGNANPSFVVWDADAEDVGERVDFS